MKAEWRPAPGFPNYEVSSLGYVRSLRFKKSLAPSLSDSGYLRVKLHAHGKRVWQKVHILVIKAFGPPRPSAKHVVAHGPDNRRTNNRITNLTWKLPHENEADKKIHGTWSNGIPHKKKRKMTEEQILRIRNDVASGKSFSEIARRENLHRHSVSRVARSLTKASIRVERGICEVYGNVTWKEV